MIVNQNNLTNLYTALTTVFNNSFTETPSWYEKVAMVVQAQTRTIDYKFLLNFPMVREWIGDRQVRNLEAHNFELTTKDYEATVEVDRNDIEDNQLGIYNPMVAELGRAAKKHPDSLIAALMANGFSATCYDGKFFFAADHPVGGGTASNSGGGSSTPWYLLDTTRVVKPFLFQLRQGPQLVRQDRPDDEQVFMRKKFRYGVDYRAVAGYGLWQLAFGSKDNLNPTNYAAARTSMMSYQDADGNPLGIVPNLLVVPPSLEATAREILQAEVILGDITAGGSKTNVWRGTAELLVVPGLV